MPHASIDGTQLYYTEAGRGIPFIALHGGLGFDHAYMRTPLGPLEDLARIVYVDQRGCGRSDRTVIESISLPRLAADVDGMRQELGWERVGLVGHSYGGFVALEYATTYPDKVSHLMLWNTSPGAFEPTAQELAERPDPSTINPQATRAVEILSGTRLNNDQEFAERLPKVAPAYLHSGDASVLAMEMGRALLSAAAARKSMEVLQGWSVADKLGTITAPTLVVCGRYDLLTTPECSKRLATTIPNAELAWFEQSAHFPWLEEPQGFQDVVRDFLVEHW